MAVHQFFFKILQCEDRRKCKKLTLINLPSLFTQSFLVSNGEKERDGKKLIPTRTLSNMRCETLPLAVLTLIKTDDACSKSEFQDMCGSKHTLAIPTKSVLTTHLQFLLFQRILLCTRVQTSRFQVSFTVFYCLHGPALHANVNVCRK